MTSIRTEYYRFHIPSIFTNKTGVDITNIDKIDTFFSLLDL